FIESLDDLNETIDQSVRCFGITAGASTPKTIIQEVLKYVRDEF
ncbi:MAG: 4-hydroxy-3-methylbut-2-enyl diphosphate reductase, partial [Lachnospiraceae bacterium]|nr:4-hydroxy-3-methylbut-2-enyl diphosphate reductase [Lachnospiraceae bacterium]